MIDNWKKLKEQYDLGNKKRSKIKLSHDKIVYFPDSPREYMMQEAFGKELYSSRAYISCENTLRELISYNEKAVMDKLGSLEDDFPELKDFQGNFMTQGSYLILNGYFKEEIDKMTSYKRKVNKMSDDKLYQNHIKKGNRFARQRVLCNTSLFKKETIEIARTIPEPDTYKFKDVKQINNIGG